MAVSATYIGVILLLFILIGFVLTVIRALANSAGARIRHDMNKILSSYDTIIESKSSALDKYETESNKEHANLLKKETNNNTNTVVVKEKMLSSSSFIKKEVSHRDASLVDGYDAIKNEFRVFDEAIEDNVLSVTNSIKKSEFDDAVSRLSSAFGIDSVYDLSLESSADQLEFFRNALNKKDMIVLEKFLETRGKKNFNTIDFYDWIKLCAKEIPKNIVIRTGDKNKEADYEPSICEGYQIVAGNKLYDFSISKRDIQ